MKFGSLFSGIGGFDLGLERAGMECAWQVEIDPYATKVLKKHWPNVKQYKDVREVGKHNLEPVDLICGGFPCQDLSAAGKRAGLREGTKSGLWSEYSRIIGELRPKYVLVENVPGLLDNHAMGRVLGDLAEMRYDAEWDCLPACDFGAPFRRERIYILAIADGKYGQERMGAQPNRSKTIFAGHHRLQFPFWLQAADQFIGMDDGVSGRLYQDRGRCLGNAVVPQIVEWIGRQIIKTTHTG